MIAEMGDSAFKLGNVYKNSYDEMMSSPVCKTVCAASVLGSLPECTDVCTNRIVEHARL